VAVVTKPFEYEGKRKRVAEEGRAELAKHVDSLIVILNEKLEEVLGEEISIPRSLQDRRQRAAQRRGRHRRDHQRAGPGQRRLRGRAHRDARDGQGHDGFRRRRRRRSRPHRRRGQAVASPLLEGIELSGARGVLVNITASSTLGLKEYKEVMKTIRQYTAPEATVICGTVFDEGMEDQLRVTVVATGWVVSVAREGAKPAMRVVETMGLRTGTDNLQVYEAGTGTGIDLSTVTASGRTALRNSQARRWSIRVSTSTTSRPSCAASRTERQACASGRAGTSTAGFAQPAGCGGAKHASRNPASPSRPAGWAC
jgi:cell division protein FtsZ